MQVSRTAVIHCFRSWDREYPDTLTVVREPDHVQLLLCTAHSSSGSVTLTKAEAVQLGDDIAGLFSSAYRFRDMKIHGEGNTQRVDESSGLVLSVMSTNRGEPYEEGLIIEIGQAGEYPAAFSIDLSERTAWEFSQMLRWA